MFPSFVITFGRTSGTKNSELYNVGPGFDQTHGRYVAPVEGYYLCSTNLRLDNVATSSFMRLVVAVNGADQKCAPGETERSQYVRQREISISVCMCWIVNMARTGF